uniref:PDZ domain-containing protein n=1 Tax=Mesocestoides corti TaxID=53468 RepID=A0A5K3FIV1_MESCO
MDSETESGRDKVVFCNNDQSSSLAVRDYARQLSERKRLEEERRKEDRFLRRSLRQSEKLRALARAQKVAKYYKQVSAAAQNLAFDGAEGLKHDSGYKLDEFGYGGFIEGLRHKLVEQKEEGESSDIDELGDDEWDWLAKKVSDKSVLQAFNLHDTIATVLERTRVKMGGAPMNTWAGNVAAIPVVNAVTSELKGIPATNRVAEMNELLELLNKPEIRGALSSFDGVARVWARQAEKGHEEDDFGHEDLVTSGDTVERTVFTSPVEGCYKILAVDDQGNTVSTPDGTTLVNVILQKSGEEFFGATVRTEGSAIVIGRIVSGGLIERTGLLNEGDELLSVNGVDLMGKDVDHVSHILTHFDGQIDLLVAPVLPITESPLIQEETVAHLRALFSYEPSNDVYNPCPEASVAFDKGDILRILNTRDPNWWQALRIEETGAVGVSGSMAGLVPSPYFQRYRSLIRLKRANGYTEDAVAGYSESEDSDFELDSPSTDASGSLASTRLSTSTQSLWVSPTSVSTLDSGTEPLWSAHGVGPKQLKKQRQKKSRKARLLSILSGSTSRKLGGVNKRTNEYEICMEMNSLRQADGDQLRQLVDESVRDKIRRPSLLTYELVDLYYPQPQRRRPLVFVGPKHVGRQLLIEGLIRGDPKRFAMPDIHTTNPDAKSTEFQHYEIISKQEFQRMHREKLFVEWGVYNHHYYGTKVSSIEVIVKAGKVCVIALRPDSIRAIRRTPFLPCVIFVSPPDNLGDLHKLRNNLGQSSDISVRLTAFS